MADEALGFLLDNLRQLLLHHSRLISNAKHNVEMLEKELCQFNATLINLTQEEKKDKEFGELVGNMRSVIYDAEDAIDEYVTEAAEIKAMNCFMKAFLTPIKLLGIANVVNGVRSKVKEINDYRRANVIATQIFQGGGSEECKLVNPKVGQRKVVGFEEEIEKIMGYLYEETQHLDVISIIGMPGLGKTTLAMEIFSNPTIQSEFPTRIWVDISQDFTERNIFLAILGKCYITEDHSQSNDQDLARHVCSYLERGKFLIVMDDVWRCKDWDKLQIAFPKSNNEGKILITSRHVEVANNANRVRKPHELRCLTHDEGLLLLKLSVFGKPDSPHQDFEIPGNTIVEQCQGLPLPIVLIGDIFVIKSLVSDEISVKNEWNKVDNVSRYLKNEDSENQMEKIIALSYDKLPHHLRVCFLYFGIFPEKYKIPVWKLIRMWIAEGFIIKPNSNDTLEETAEKYLNDLINLNLVMVDKKKPDGRVNTCTIHKILYEYCKTEAQKYRENFLQEIKMSTEGGFDPPSTKIEKYRRLCIHNKVLSFLSSKPSGPRVRSFACFSDDEIHLPKQNISVIPATFKLLRVLEVKPIKFTKIPSNLYQLVHLRYITLSFKLSILPSHFSKLWNLQTLIVYTVSRTIEIKADIWNMVQLRHLKTNASAILPKLGRSSKEDVKLQTLGTISPQSCTKEVFNRACNLKKLGIRGVLSLLTDGRNGSFDSLVELRSLVKLKLVNDVFPNLASEGHFPKLPRQFIFPRELRSLTLSNTFLEWSEMNILGLLHNLQVLKLKDKAFMGKTWATEAGGFRCLEVLHIGQTNLVTWLASGHHFPRLKRLDLRKCEELKGIPIELADITSLKVLNLYQSEFAVISAERIRDVIMNKKNSGFNLILDAKLMI